MDAQIPLVDRLKAAYPTITFTGGETFQWNPDTQTIAYIIDEPMSDERLLHETAHAQLQHTDYHRDIELIAMERDAWELARRELGPRFDIEITRDVIDQDMDTYRDWLHARSTCPACSATGIQTADDTYTCVACRTTWRVNQAKGCALRRYITKRPE